MPLQLRVLILVLATFFFANSGFAATAATGKAKKAKRPSARSSHIAKAPKRAPAPMTPGPNAEMMSIADSGYPLSRNWDRPKPAPLALTPVSTGSTAVTAAPIADSAPTRIVNFRLHPVYFINMIAQSDTLLEFRADLDFLATDHFTIGPSVFYHQTAALDGLLSNTATINVTQIELGLLSNIYVTGTSSTGGLLFRPHVYYIDVSGNKQDSQSQVVATGSATNGWRTGLELVYQKILPFGLNFEIGGGFTYYVVPYSVNYSDNAGTKSTGPDNPVAPTVTLGVGWAF